MTPSKGADGCPATRARGDRLDRQALPQARSAVRLRPADRADGERHWIPLGPEREGWNDVRAADRRAEIAAPSSRGGVATAEPFRTRSP